MSWGSWRNGRQLLMSVKLPTQAPPRRRASGSATLPWSTNLHRVPDATDAGTGFVSANTWLGNLPTDIPQDFAVDDGSTFSYAELCVPAGATHIFYTVSDSLFGDNADPNGDFGAETSIIPEPSTPALALAGLLLGLLSRTGLQRMERCRGSRLGRDE